MGFTGCRSGKVIAQRADRLLLKLFATLYKLFARVPIVSRAKLRRYCLLIFGKASVKLFKPSGFLVCERAGLFVNRLPNLFTERVEAGISRRRRLRTYWIEPFKGAFFNRA
ncbi:hypothetical protein D3C80_931470 [compost metagenome]